MTVHLVELEGRGGPFQHSFAIAAALHRDGVDVVLHTATDAELLPSDELTVCRCMDWLRDSRRQRRSRIAARYLGRTLPHLLRVVRGGDVLHIQGPFKPALVAATVGAARILRRRVVFSPHNTFSRQDRALDAAIVRGTARLADVTVVYSAVDEAVVRRWGAQPAVSFLLQHAPTVDEAAARCWRAHWGGRRVVLFAGQVRPDKRLDLLIESSRLWQSDATLAVVGRDAGDAERCRLVAESVGADVHWTLEYVPLPLFLAAISAADVVVCPHSRASQSGVLALAAQLGVPAVATAVGGLAALASATVPSAADAYELARAIDAVLELPRIEPINPEAEAVAAHRRAYALAKESP